MLEESYKHRVGKFVIILICCTPHSKLTKKLIQVIRGGEKQELQGILCSSLRRGIWKEHAPS